MPINKEMAQIVTEKTNNLFSELKEREAEIKENKDWIEFDVIATTEDVDRDWEIIKGDGLDTENWFKNPVILANHSYRVESIVGKWLEFYMDKEWRRRLKGTFTQATEMGRIASELYKSGFLKAVSIGFIVKQRNESDRLIIEKAELLEVSFVAVPANPNALATGWKSFEKALELGLLKEVKEDEEKKDDEIKNAPTRDLTSLWNIDEKQIEFASKLLDMVEDIIKEKEVAILKEMDIIKESIKSLPDDNGNGDDSKTHEEVVQDFFKNLSKNVSQSLYQMKKWDKQD